MGVARAQMPLHGDGTHRQDVEMPGISYNGILAIRDLQQTCAVRNGMEMYRKEIEEAWWL